MRELVRRASTEARLEIFNSNSIVLIVKIQFLSRSISQKYSNHERFSWKLRLFEIEKRFSFRI